MRYDVPPAPMEEDDWERWQRLALTMAEQARSCVTLLVCVEGHCRQITAGCDESAPDRAEADQIGGYDVAED